MGVIVREGVFVRVDVAVEGATVVAVGGGGGEGPPPAGKEPGAQEPFYAARGNPGALVGDFRQVAGQGHEREPPEHAGRALAQTPEKTY